jgi:general secretion pathway protein L
MQMSAPALGSFVDATSRFLGWWRDELVALVPERVRRLFAAADARLVLAEVDGGFAIVGASAGPPGAAPAVLPRAEALAALAEAAAARGVASVGIRLASSHCFERRVELPRAAREDVRRMLSFDLERATPFRPAEVYTAHLVPEDKPRRWAGARLSGTGTPGPKGRQRLRQLIVKREAVDALLADVRAAGLEPAFVDCWQESPAAGLPVDFLDSGGPRRSGLASYVTLPRALAALALLLAALVPVIALSRYDAALAELRARTAEARAQAAGVRGAQARADAALADLKRLQTLKLAQVPTVEVLEALSRLLPDSVWLSDLRLEGDTLDISGLAKSGAALPSLFSGSALFADAQLTAPVTLDPREDRERFSLRVRIKPPDARHRPPAEEERP